MQKIKNIIERVKGFTLIELLIVIAIIGVLASSVVVSTGEARKNSRDVRRLEDLKQIANAMELYLDSNNRVYPDALSSLAPNYIPVVPKDPQTQADYFYCTNGTGVNDGTTFHLAAAMEKYNPTFFDADADLDADGCTTGSFQGYSESCVEAQKCNGEFCDNCLDFSNMVEVGDVGDDTGGNTGGNQCNSGNNPDLGKNWTVQNVPGNFWFSVAYGNGTFVAVGYGSQSNNRIMTSTDGINWTLQSAAGDNDNWQSVVYGNGLFVAVSAIGDPVATSPDGINWTARSAAGNNDSWTAVTYGNGLFVAVGAAYWGEDRVMTSPDGINWTVRSAARNNDNWESIIYANGLFVAVSSGGYSRIMTSPDGINWTIRSSSLPWNTWMSVAYGNGTFVAVAYSGGDRVMTSPDGINWTTHSAADNNDKWHAVTYGDGLFVAVGESSGGGDSVMTSSDGINWTVQSAAGDNDRWRSVVYVNGMLLAVGDSGDYLMTSGTLNNNCP